MAIHFNIEARDCYARSPYHLDERNQLHIPLLVQLFRGTSSGNKHDLEPSTTPPTCAAVPCQNWSLELCDDPCSNRRKHGVCSECGKEHRSKDVESWHASLQERRRGATAGVGTGGSGSSRA